MSTQTETVVSAAPGVSGQSRLRRWTEFQTRFPDFGEMNVLDLGGTTAFWEAAPVEPAMVTMFNLTQQACTQRWMRYSHIDVCASFMRPTSYDLVLSNSVIGHVGGHAQREQFAYNVHRCGDRHWIQTPYRYFPLDAFHLFPGLMSLPVALRAQVSLHWPFGTRQALSHKEAVDLVLGVEFLSKTEMRHYFPRSELWSEKMAGFTKSLVAVKS